MVLACNYFGVIMRVALLGICVASCASMGVSMIVKPPLQSQCQRLPISGCGELVDGVLLYVQGEKAEALDKIRQAKAANEPEQLKPFAKALRDAASLPGAESVAAPMNEVADLLDSDTGPRGKPPTRRTANAGLHPPVPAGAAAASKAGENTQDPKPEVAGKPPLARDPAARALSATADIERLVTDTVDLSIVQGRTPCKVSGLDALCIKVKAGPVVVTDVIAPRSCPERIFVVSTLSDSPDFGLHWFFEAGPVPVTGARMLISDGDWLQFAIVPAKKGPSNSPECAVAWSGFRPWTAQ